MVEGSYADQKAVARANRGFYRAFEALDPAAMERVWSSADEVRCVHPGGEMLCGRQRVLASWEAIFAATEAISFELHDVSIQVAGNVGWVTNVEIVLDPRQPKLRDSIAAATNVYRREAGEWLLVLHHASPIARRFFPEGT